MTDPRSHRHEGPSDDAVEVRLRRTLGAVADREPVAPQLDDLRHRVSAATPVPGGDRAVPFDRRPARRRIVGGLIAAAVLAVVVAGAVVVARDDGTETTGMMSAPPPGRGWYLPGSGTGWEVVGITGVPWAQRLSARREVGFATPDRTAGLGIEEYQRAGGDTDPVASLEQVERGSGATTRTYGVHFADTNGSPELVVARRGDRVLHVNVRDVDAETVYGVVDGWWESEGERIDPVPGMVRTSDLSGDDGRRGHTQVIVTARRTADGLQVSYALSPSGATLVPTGIDDEDLGAWRGLEEDVRPRPIEGVPDQPGPAWEVGPDSMPGSTSVFSRGDGADIVIADDLSFAPPVPGAAPGDPGSDVEQVIRRRAHIELLGALRTTSAEAWADAVAQVDADPQLAAPTIADVPTGDIGPGTTTTVQAETDDPQATSSTTTAPSTASSAIDSRVRAHAEALIAFARDPSDATFEELDLIDRLDLAVWGRGVGDIPADLLRDPAAWGVVDRRGSEEEISALALIADAGAVELTDVASAISTCPHPTFHAASSSTNVAIVPVDPASCDDDFTIIVVTTDDGLMLDEVTVVPPSP